MNLYIPHNRRTPLQAEEALGPISIPGVPARLSPFRELVPLGRRNLVALFSPCTPSGRGVEVLERGQRARLLSGEKGIIIGKNENFEFPLWEIQTREWKNSH
jgi:hypothetical protein